MNCLPRIHRETRKKDIFSNITDAYSCDNQSSMIFNHDYAMASLKKNKKKIPRIQNNFETNYYEIPVGLMYPQYEFPT